MSLLSTDITKVKRLSLREVNFRPPTDEEIAYSKLVAINPLIEELVDRFNLVSNTTGERIKKIELREDIKQPHKDIDKPKLIALAQRVIQGENIYSKEEIVARIKEATNVNQERAEKGLNLILQAGAIEIIPGERYIIKGSTPF